MEKKGQFYLVAAIIIIIVIVGLSTITNYAVTKDKPLKFYDLSEELSEEGARVVDYGIYQSKGIPKVIEDFLGNVTEYSEEKEKNTEFVFVYGNDQEAKAATYMSEDTGDIRINYGANNFTLSGEEILVLTTVPVVGEEIKIEVLNKIYTFTLKEGENFLFVIKKDKEGERYAAQSD